MKVKWKKHYYLKTKIVYNFIKTRGKFQFMSKRDINVNEGKFYQINRDLLMLRKSYTVRTMLCRHRDRIGYMTS